MKNKSTLTLVLTPIIIAIGQILYLTVPSIGGVIRPDFSLVSLFLVVMIQPKFKQAVLSSLLLVTLATILGGNPIFQIPSIFDRLGSAILVLFLYRLLLNSKQTFFRFKIGGIFMIATAVSGTIYMLATYLFGTFLGLSELKVVFSMGLPFLVVAILTTALVNFFVGMIVYEVLAKIAHGRILIEKVRI
ncbi:MAG: hypothetical protein LBV67_07580 [Streptococcaceae bacterium]|jgi:hypothetical protein|nr:hypothetical protein [Streptococcaceae bacterium]